MDIIIKHSNKKDKKFDAIINGSKTVSFGAKGYSDFTQHKDTKRKDRYLNRHKKNENWNDPLTAGFYATNLLWNQPTIKSSIAETNKKFKGKLHIKLKIP